MEALLDLFRCRKNVRNVRLFGLTQRRRHTDNDCVAVGQLGKVDRGFKAFLFHQALEHRGVNIADIRVTSIYSSRLVSIDFKAGSHETAARKLDQQRQSDVAKADDTDARAFFGYERY